MSNDCDCQSRFTVRIGRASDYDRAKQLLNKGRHPAFIGRTSLGRWAEQGGLVFATLEDQDIAVAAINTRNGTLMVLNIHPDHRSHGLGSVFIDYLKPNFARVVESAVPWFERQGYTALGEWKQGRSLRTRVMARNGLFDVAGRVASRIGDTCHCTEHDSPRSA